jgi:hypothetical protein
MPKNIQTFGPRINEGSSSLCRRGDDSVIDPQYSEILYGIVAVPMDLCCIKAASHSNKWIVGGGQIGRNCSAPSTAGFALQTPPVVDFEQENVVGGELEGV